jgi:glycerol-3-phosphate dehydrogenase
MIRDLKALAGDQFDLLVVGGGVLGACVARDAALRGLRTALVERDDFAAGTSANSLKIVHGGLRYLQRLDLLRVRESIMERAAWLRTAPHLVEPLPVLLPAFRGSVEHPVLLRLAASAANTIGWGQDRGLPPERRVGHSVRLSRAECVARVPELAQPDLIGGLLFHDARMYSSERLVLEVVIGASEAGAVIANYAECEAQLRAPAGAVVRVRDRIGGGVIEVRASVIVNAGGPAAPGLVARLAGRTGERAAIPHALALNIMLPGAGHDVAFALSAPRRPGTARRKLFVVPWRGRTIIGTAHYRYDGPTERTELPEAAVEQFLAEVNAAWQGRSLSRDDVVLVHRGLLPMPAVHHAEPGLLDRHRIVDHASEGISGLITAFSAKYTTGRRAAQDVVDLVFRKLGRTPPPSRTAHTLLPGAPRGSVAELLAAARGRYGEVLDPDVLEHLVRSYGVRYERVIAYRSSMPDWRERVDAVSPVIRAQLAYGVEQEMAILPDDLILRRTELGAIGAPTAAARECARLAVRQATSNAPAASGRQDRPVIGSPG